MIDFAVYLITDGVDVERVERALAGGVAVQLRDRSAGGRVLLERARRLREVTASRARLFVNDRVDVALAAGADGVHLPASGLTVDAVRRIAPALLVGASTHTLDEARTRAGADFVVFGPVWPTATHPGAAPVGVGALGEVARALGIPVFALGGVTPERAREVVAVGARVAGTLGTVAPLT